MFDIAITVLNKENEHLVLNYWQREIYESIVKKLHSRKSYFECNIKSTTMICGIHQVTFTTRKDNDNFWEVIIKADDYYIKHNGRYEHIIHPEMTWFIQK